VVLVIIRNPDAPLQTGRVLRGGQHALIELLAAQREAGVNHVALNLKPTRRDALDLFQSRTEVFIHRRAVTGAGCITGRNGSRAARHSPQTKDSWQSSC